MAQFNVLTALSALLPGYLMVLTICLSSGRYLNLLHICNIEVNEITSEEMFIQCTISYSLNNIVIHLWSTICRLPTDKFKLRRRDGPGRPAKISAYSVIVWPSAIAIVVFATYEAMGSGYRFARHER
jgi:hypothetical protein